MIRHLPRELVCGYFLTELGYLLTSVAGLRATREVDLETTFEDMLASGLFIKPDTGNLDTLSIELLLTGHPRYFGFISTRHLGVTKGKRLEITPVTPISPVIPIVPVDPVVPVSPIPPIAPLGHGSFSE